MINVIWRLPLDQDILERGSRIDAFQNIEDSSITLSIRLSYLQTAHLFHKPWMKLLHLKTYTDWAMDFNLAKLAMTRKTYLHARFIPRLDTWYNQCSTWICVDWNANCNVEDLENLRIWAFKQKNCRYSIAAYTYSSLPSIRLHVVISKPSTAARGSCVLL